MQDQPENASFRPYHPDGHLKMTDIESTNPAPIESADRQSRTANEIYMALREMILSFDLYPGTRITENELARRFNVSRTPVREALQKLETEGYLTIMPKQGCFIRNLDISELSNYYQVRITLEMLAVENACAHMPTKDVEQLLALWNPATQVFTEDAARTLGEKDEQFHIALANGSSNLALGRYLADINNRIRIIRRLDLADERRTERTYNEHYEILQAVLQRDASKAKRLIKKHIEKSELFAKTLTLTELARRKTFVKPR